MREFVKIAVVAFALLCVVGLAETARATNYAGLVIRHGDGSVVTRCVAFEESSISGIELLYRSGLAVDAPTSGYGASVYGIDGEGTAEDWSSGRASWSYWHVRGGWVFSPIGASSYSVKQGDVDGWSWGSQTGPTPPPAYSFGQLYRDAYGAPAPAPPPANTNVQPANGATTAPATPGATNASTAAAANPAGASNSGATTTNVRSGAGKKAVTAMAARHPADKKVQKDGNFWNYASFAMLLAGLSAGFVYYQRKNRQSVKPN